MAGKDQPAVPTAEASDAAGIEPDIPEVRILQTEQGADEHLTDDTM